MPSRTSRPDDVGESQRADRMLVAERHRLVDVLGADATPSSSMRIASSPRATPSRDDAKPGASVDDDRGLADRVRPTRGPRPRARRSVASPRTISTSVEAGTGLKKCMPRNRSGRSSSAASWSIEIDEVFEASAAPGASTASTRVRASIFSSRSSGTASTTRSQRAKSSTSVLVAKRAAMRGLVVVGGAAGDGGRDRLEHARRRGRGGIGVAFDDRDARPREQEGVRDARAHASAAEHADVGRGPGRGLAHFFCFLLEELGHASQLLGALEEHRLLLEVDGGVRGARRAEHALRRDGRGPVVAGDAVGDRVRRGQQLVGGMQLAHEPDLERLVGADRASGEQQLDRTGLAHDLPADASSRRLRR